MRCPGCGETNDEGYRFCRRCGRALVTREAPLDPASPASLPTTPAAAAIAPSEPPPTHRLLAIAGLLAGRSFTIGPAGLAVGRDPANCQVVIADDEISRLHAWLGMNERGEVVVRDRHSANGTFVNKVRIQERVLRPTDEICFGSGRPHLFRIERVEAPSGNPTTTAQDKPARPNPGEAKTVADQPALNAPPAVRRTG